MNAISSESSPKLAKSYSTATPGCVARLDRQTRRHRQECLCYPARWTAGGRRAQGKRGSAIHVSDQAAYILILLWPVQPVFAGKSSDKLHTAVQDFTFGGLPVAKW
jgi:hypothetical protein